MEKKELVENIKKATKDFGKVAGEAAIVAADALKQGGEQLLSTMDQAKQDYDRKRLNPIFDDDIKAEGYVMPRMIRVLESDKQRMDNPVCQGSIGFGLSAKGFDVLNIYTKNAPYIGKTFFPALEEGVYFIDPSNDSLYINMNDYFEFIQSAKVEELNRIAQDLGASYVKISLKSAKKNIIKQNAKGDVKAKGKLKANATQDVDNQSYENIEIESETRFKGHTYHDADLHYFKEEQKILSLIEMRKNPNNPMQQKTLRFAYNNSSGIKKKDVAAIEAAISMMDVGGNASVSSEIQKEERTIFEYTVEFPD